MICQQDANLQCDGSDDEGERADAIEPPELVVGVHHRAPGDPLGAGAASQEGDKSPDFLRNIRLPLL